MGQFETGTPIDFIEIALSDAVITLDPLNHAYAVVQFKDTADNYVGVESRVALYTREVGNVPAQVGSVGFVAGLHDTIVFSNAELRSGVNIINYTNGSDCSIVVQYFHN